MKEQNPFSSELRRYNPSPEHTDTQRLYMRLVNLSIQEHHNAFPDVWVDQELQRKFHINPHHIDEIDCLVQGPIGENPKGARGPITTRLIHQFRPIIIPDVCDAVLSESGVVDTSSWRVTNLPAHRARVIADFRHFYKIQKPYSDLSTAENRMVFIGELEQAYFQRKDGPESMPPIQTVLLSYVEEIPTIDGMPAPMLFNFHSSAMCDQLPRRAVTVGLSTLAQPSSQTLLCLIHRNVTYQPYCHSLVKKRREAINTTNGKKQRTGNVYTGQY